ncbi:MAG: MFS transporter [Planctomycetes bacterium]|nr:MFS transporter [Planctomycetota bacterium]MCB9871798.1 MFS transporter [Planctomycetota bacterium]
MMLRFCSYGFLKNQRYFEPFLWLALLEREMSYAAIGTLVAIRELSTHLLEIPSGAAADLFGRRRAMIAAFGAYVISFVTFARAESFVAFAAAMALFGAGEAFRTGTHKAMIFRWLEIEGRTDEKTRVYGITRSWSKFGSALSALIAAMLVITSSNYAAVFWWSILPCALNVLNLATYPAAVDPPPNAPRSPGAVWAHVRSTLLEALRRPALRRPLIESMGFNGLFHATKDYLQPALLATATAWLLGSGDMEVARRILTAALTGPVYFGLFLAAGFASRGAHRFADWSGGDRPAALRLWSWLAFTCAAMLAATWTGLPSIVVTTFVLLHVLDNLWRPILTSWVYSVADSGRGATVLSVESQGHRVTTMALAPLLGWMVDCAGSLWPVAATALAIAVGFRIAAHFAPRY